MHDCVNLLEDKDQAHQVLHGTSIEGLTRSNNNSSIWHLFSSAIFHFKFQEYLPLKIPLSYWLELKCHMKGFPGSVTTWTELGSHYIHLTMRKGWTNWKTLTSLGPIRELRSAKQSTPRNLQKHRNMESQFGVYLCGGEVTEVPNWQRHLGNKFGVCWRLCELIRDQKTWGSTTSGGPENFHGFYLHEFLMWRSKKNPFSSSDRGRLNIVKYTLAFAIMKTYPRRGETFPGPYPIWEKGILALCPSLVFLSHIEG